MLSIKDRKLIFQLSKKKYRLLNKLFVAEGEKTIQELISNGWKYEMLFSTKKNLYPDSISDLNNFPSGDQEAQVMTKGTHKLHVFLRCLLASNNNLK